MGVITRRALAVVLLSAAVVTAGAVPAQSAPARSSSAQSSSAQLAPDFGLTGVRTGRHPGFDRVVLDFAGSAPPEVHNYRFVDELTQDGSGHIEWLTGTVFLEVIIFGTYTHDFEGNPIYTGPPKFRTRNLSNVMAVSVPPTYEAVLTLGIGIRKKTWARVFTLTSPSRIVIDVGR
ncbi:MAG: AMIN-like domain-containing (lipo)protein [Pseudonocardiaceae bacterium]